MNGELVQQGPDDLPPSIDVEQAKPVSPEPAPPVQLDPLAEAGVTLAKWVLVIISGVLAVLFVLLAINEFYTPDFLTDAYSKASTGADSDALITKILEARAAARDFWFKMAQLVLLNLLLPVLTAILGYVFGSKQHSARGAV